MEVFKRGVCAAQISTLQEQSRGVGQEQHRLEATLRHLQAEREQDLREKK
jgi:hypothetical protein